MIFVRYEDWRSYLKEYKVTSLLIFINVIVYLLVMLNGGTDDWQNMIDFGAMLKVEPYAYETWRMFTSMFLHNSFDHILFNMFSLFIFAPPLERAVGHFKFAFLYLASGIVGNAISNWGLDWGVLSVGASGAIYGIFGAYLFIVLFHRQSMDQASRKMIGFIVIVGAIQSLLIDNIDWYSHFGGLAAGFVLFELLRRIR